MFFINLISGHYLGQANCDCQVQVIQYKTKGLSITLLSKYWLHWGYKVLPSLGLYFISPWDTTPYTSSWLADFCDRGSPQSKWIVSVAMNEGLMMIN